MGDVTNESCAYVARYILKKINGQQKEKHYENINKSTGLLTNKLPEFIAMSTKPGIARDYYNLHKKDFYRDDTCKIKKGNRIISLKVPRYYDKIYEVESPEDFKKIKDARLKKGIENQHNSTPERLKVRRQIQIGKNKQLIRSYENESL